MSSLSRQLVELITKSLETLEATCSDKNLAVPDLYKPFHSDSEAFRADPQVAEAAAVISAAALHLEAIYTSPQASLYRLIGGHFKSAAIRICLESNVTEILREGGPQGVHVDDIAAQNGQDPQKLGRCIRFLATHHVYKELTPNVFTNTRISSLMDTMKPSKEIISDPEHKHDNTIGLPALMSHHLDEAFKATAYLWEMLADPETRMSGDANTSPFSRAIKAKESLWDFYKRPEESFRHHRFGIGMRGIEALQAPDAIQRAYEWDTLPKDSLVVDVGGGIGTSCMPLARRFPDIKFVVQDLAGVIDDAKKYWRKNMPAAVESGRVKLHAHDFFQSQPEKTASLFLLKQITHDWSDDYCVKILTQLRASAMPHTKLLVLDSIIPYSCHDPSADDDTGIPGAVGHEAPAPLLANFGAANEMVYNADIDMFALFNSQERTITQFETLLRNAGWKLTLVRRQGSDSTFIQSIEGVPM